MRRWILSYRGWIIWKLNKKWQGILDLLYIPTTKQIQSRWMLTRYRIFLWQYLFFLKKVIINSYWTRRWRIPKFIQSRQAISDEGFPELDITCRDWINLISVITACINFFIIPKNKCVFPDHFMRELVEWTISSWIL